MRESAKVGTIDLTSEFTKSLIAENDMLLRACKAVEPIVVAAVAFVDCNRQLEQLRAAIAKADSL